MLSDMEETADLTSDLASRAIDFASSSLDWMEAEVTDVSIAWAGGSVRTELGGDGGLGPQGVVVLGREMVEPVSDLL